MATIVEAPVEVEEKETEAEEAARVFEKLKSMSKEGGEGEDDDED